MTPTEYAEECFAEASQGLKNLYDRVFGLEKALLLATLVISEREDEILSLRGADLDNEVYGDGDCWLVLNAICEGVEHSGNDMGFVDEQIRLRESKDA
jgi:hypothetical protein